MVNHFKWKDLEIRKNSFCLSVDNFSYEKIWICLNKTSQSLDMKTLSTECATVLLSIIFFLLHFPFSTTSRALE